MRKKHIALISGAIVIFFLAGYIGLYHIAPYAVMKPPRYRISEHPNSFPHGATPQSHGLRSHPFQITVQDTIKLRGWLLEAASKPTKGTVVLLHGIGSCKEHMLDTGEWLSREGFNVILYDSRAHGESGGIYCTYGYYEAKDLSVVLDTLTHQYPHLSPFAVYGNSFGGAVALQSLAIDSRLSCGIIESSFATLEEVAYDYMKRLTGIPFHWVSHLVLQRAGEIAGFQPERVNPAAAARHITQPVLIIHGTEDDHVSIRYGRRIYQQLSSRKKVWYPVPGGTHYNLWKVGGEAYSKQILNFLNDCLSDAAPDDAGVSKTG